MNEDFSGRLKASRIAAGLKAKQLAEICGISPSYLSELESGKRINPAKLLLDKFAGECGVTVDWLLGRDDSPAPNQLRNRGVTKLEKGNQKTETPGNIEDSELHNTPVMKLEKGRGLADYPRMEPMAKDEAVVFNARQLSATIKDMEDGERLLGYLASILMWLNAAILPDTDPDVKATALRQAHLVYDKLASSMDKARAHEGPAEKKAG
jgi:transcriptional regulator with XRE-family HTH domain